MNTRSRLLFAAASLTLLLALLFPLWTISLSAPQYPEGIGLKIWAHQITGQREQDLHNINGLNHYIGMKTIVPDSIPELRILPVALAGMAALGFLGAWLGRRWLLGLWLGLLLADGSASLVDFWLWEYDYGHNLDPSAAIQVPGMTYQPPLIGTRQLLNMRTTALPGLGALSLGLGLGLGVAAWTAFRPGQPAPRPRPNQVRTALVAGLLLLGVVGVSCQAGVREIRYRQDTCARCRMIVMDPRYGCELVTRRGKALIFDSVECLAAHTLEVPDDARESRVLLVTHHARPARLAAADSSLYLRCAELPSPMGLGLSACADRHAAEELRRLHGGELLSWPQVLTYVRGAWKIP
jgi:copper chaperone NosL